MGIIMDKDGLVFSYITEYMRNIRRERDGDLGDLERKARIDNLPICVPETADLLDILCRLKSPKRILEIGACIGFSSLLMCRASPFAEIITVERNPLMISAAEENFKRFNANNIKMMKGDAVEILPTLSEPFDFIFLDAAKGQYPIFLNECIRLLNPKGVLIADNVLFNGYVAKGIPDVRRNKTIITRLDEFLKNLKNNKELNTVILPISDGVTVSYKKT